MASLTVPSDPSGTTKTSNTFSSDLTNMRKRHLPYSEHRNVRNMNQKTWAASNRVPGLLKVTSRQLPADYRPVCEQSVDHVHDHVH